MHIEQNLLQKSDTLYLNQSDEKEENKIQKVFTDTINAPFEVSSMNEIKPVSSSLETVAPRELKKRKKRKKSKKPSLMHFTGTFIIKMQEIFKIMKKENPSFPTFNTWLKEFLYEFYFGTYEFGFIVYFNLIKKINSLRDNPEIKNNINYLNVISQFEVLILLTKDIWWENAKIEQKDKFESIVLEALKLISTMHFVNPCIRNNFSIICHFLKAYLNHSNFCQMQFKTVTLFDIITHPNTNFLCHTSFSAVIRQLKESISDYNYYFNQFHSLIKDAKKFNQTLNYTRKIVTPAGDEVDNIHFNPLILIRRIQNEFKKLESKLNIDLNSQEYFDVFNNILQISNLFNEFDDAYLETPQFFNELEGLFKKNNLLMVNLKYGNNYDPDKTILDIFKMSAFRIELWPLFIDNFNLGLALLLQNNSFDIQLIQDYFLKIVNLHLKIRKAFFPEEDNDSDVNFAFSLYERYEKEKVQEKKLHISEIHELIQNILKMYRPIEVIVKDFLLSNIKINMFCLKKEKNPLKINEIKTLLTEHTELYENCIELISLILKIFNLHPERLVENFNDTPIINTEIQAKEELPLVNSQEDIKEDCLEIKNEIPQSFVPSKLKSKTNEEVTFKEIKHKKVNIHPELSLYDEFNKNLSDFGMTAHMKRRDLLKILKDNGWNIDATSGKGSHTKIRGPNGTTTIVPLRKVIPVGTLNSLKNSILEDKLKEQDKSNAVIHKKRNTKRK